jgi:hypothetical protein
MPFSTMHNGTLNGGGVIPGFGTRIAQVRPIHGRSALSRWYSRALVFTIA